MKQYYIFTAKELEVYPSLVNFFYKPRQDLHQILMTEKVDQDIRDLINIKEILGSYTWYKETPRVFIQQRNLVGF